ncbi:MAG: hypothetical protein NZL90_00080 [Aquificaceae bacterium]|nr:hypothetical protein [Aquificaceae bacterium]MDW8236892.1 hypothetical protein [Aquificaceae bacterium]
MKHLLVLFIIILSCQPIPEGFNPEDYKNQTIEGVIYISKELQGETAGKNFLIVSVRDPNEIAPLAVLNIKNPSFPQRFKIDGKNKINHERPIKGRVIILARLSSFQGTNAQEGDLIGTTQAVAGQRDVVITISTRLE